MDFIELKAPNLRKTLFREPIDYPSLQNTYLISNSKANNPIKMGEDLKKHLVKEGIETVKSIQK